MTRSFLVPSATHPDTPDVVAGGSDTVDGADLFGVDGGPPPGVTAAVIAMHEAGVPGPICRSQQFAPTANFAFVHMLTSDATPVGGDVFAFLERGVGRPLRGRDERPAVELRCHRERRQRGARVRRRAPHRARESHDQHRHGDVEVHLHACFTMAIAPATDVDAAHVLALTTPTAGQLALDVEPDAPGEW